jgi:hypothetical protein
MARGREKPWRRCQNKDPLYECGGTVGLEQETSRRKNIISGRSLSHSSICTPRNSTQLNKKDTITIILGLVPSGLAG